MKSILTRNDIKRFGRKAAIENTKDGILEIPEGYTWLEADFAYFVVRPDLPRVNKLIIPSTVSYIETMRGDLSSGPYGYRDNPFSEIVVSKDNKNYASLDGVLFSKDMKRLISYPCGKKDTNYKVPEGVESLECEAFLNVEHLEKITLPKSVNEVDKNAFIACEKLDISRLRSRFDLSDGEWL